jgi:hypothetical protein
MSGILAMPPASRSVCSDIADELRRRYVEFDEVPEEVLAFIEANQPR